MFAGPMTKTDNVMTQAAYAKQAPEKKHGDGAEFILREAREHPGEITLIAIGPLFTVQAAIETRSRDVQEAEAGGDHGRQH